MSACKMCGDRPGGCLYCPPRPPADSAITRLVEELTAWRKVMAQLLDDRRPRFVVSLTLAEFQEIEARQQAEVARVMDLESVIRGGRVEAAECREHRWEFRPGRPRARVCLACGTREVWRWAVKDMTRNGCWSASEPPHSGPLPQGGEGEAGGAEGKKKKRKNLSATGRANNNTPGGPGCAAGTAKQ